MDASVVCPLPELADALQPYVYTREEAKRIRNAIDAASFNNIRGDPDRRATRFTTLNNDISQEVTSLTDAGGLRSVYWRSLAANQAARARLDTLKAELASCQQDCGRPQLGDHALQEQLDETLHVITSIRRDQRRQKLHIINRTINDLEKQKQLSQRADVNHIVNDNRQTTPLPAWKASDKTKSQEDIASHILDLKKAILKARKAVDSETAPLDGRTGDFQDNDEHKRRQILALSRARDSVAIWLEDELAKISAYDDPATSSTHTYAGETLEGQEVTEQQVRDAYMNYIKLRRDLVGFMNASKASDLTIRDTAAHQEDATAPQKQQRHQPTACLAAEVLPYGKELLAITESEAALIQESTFLRRQVAWSSEKTRQMVHRLADESHLVAPAVVDVKEWARASKEACKDDEEIVQARLLAGEKSLRKAREVSDPH